MHEQYKYLNWLDIFFTQATLPQKPKKNEGNKRTRRVYSLLSAVVLLCAEKEREKKSRNRM